MTTLRTSLLFFVINLGLFFVFENGFKQIPPIAKLLNPFTGFWQNAEHKNKPRKNFTLKGVDGPIEISFDENMIPSISAKTDRDLYFAQGYVTASDRLWQMDFQARAAAGRLSEVVGEVALSFDRMQRRKGLMYGATNALRSLKEEKIFYSLIEAYVQGVNAYIKTLSYKNLPIEYKLLNYAPENFTPMHILGIAMLLADTTCGTSYALANTADYFSLGKEIFELIFPDQLYEEHPVIKKGALWKTFGSKIKVPEILEIVRPNTSNNEKAFKETPKSSGSNNWSISPIKTQSKSTTYLANDPHLDLSLPSIWYPMHLESDNLTVTGVTIPGLPGVFIGFNKNIAWGITLACMDVKGWYHIEFRDETRQEYKYENMWLKSQFVREEIKVKNGKTFYDTILYTHLGPMVYDDSFPNQYGFNNIAMKWIAHNPGKELLGVYEINKAATYTEFEQGISRFRMPVLNVNYADKDSNIALNIVGAIPNKWLGQARFVMPGRLAVYDWASYVPQDHNPKVLNPAQGYVSSANQRSTDGDYPYYYHHYMEERFRNKRINEVLNPHHKVVLKDMMKLQNDNFNQLAYDSIDLLRRSIDVTELNEKELECYNILMAWDFNNDVEKVAPSVFKAWQNKVEDILWRELYECKHLPNIHRTMAILRNEALCSKLDLGKYESAKNIIRTAFTQAVDSLLTWQKENDNKMYTWGNYRILKINHLLYIKSFGIHELKVGGGKNIVNANEGPVGSSMRLIVEFNNNSVTGYFSYPGGQSGNPGSFYYDNLVGDWECGKYIKLR